jgi:hypothetical protein
MEHTSAQWQGPPEPGPAVPGPVPWPGYGAPPPLPPPPPATSPKRLIAVLTCIGLLGVACAGSVAYGVVKALRDTTPAAETRSGDAGGSSAPGIAASAGPTRAPAGRPVGVSGKVPPGSKASSYRVRKEEDLERVCDRWYYPKSPKYTTAVAPHPIAISVKDRKDLDFRSTTSYIPLPYDVTPAVKAAWEPKNAAAVQLVACVDLVSIGPRVKSCRIDKPKPSSIPMKEGRYQVSLYEVATRRRLMQARLTGEDENCPSFILIGNDRAVYSGPEDRQLVDALRRYVEQ